VESAVHRHHIASLSRRVRASKLHGIRSKVIHSAHAAAAMWGTRTAHFRPSTPAPSLLIPFLTLTKTIKNSFPCH
jgi:hypothetical protein